MTIIVNATNDDDDVVIAVASMEEGLTPSDDDSIPEVAAVVAQPVANNSSLTTHALTGSNRFVPVAVASRLPDNPSLSSIHDEEEAERPDLLSATVYKHSQNARVGIALMNTDSGVAVKRIEPSGLFGASSFDAGDRVMSVNSESCEGLSSTEVAKLIRDANYIVTVVVRAPNGRADMVSSMVMKENSNARVGIGFKRNNGKLVISTIAENGIFAHSLLNASDTCLAINDVECTSEMDATAAVALIRASPSFVTIKAKTRHETGVVVAATATATTPEETAPISVPNASVPAQPQQRRERSVREKKCMCVFVCAIFVAVIVTVMAVSSNEEEDDYIYQPCRYMNCNVCGYNCYNTSTFSYDYCCSREYTYTCSGRCPCIHMYCNICAYTCFNDTTNQYEKCCSEQFTYTCTGGCPIESPVISPISFPYYAPAFSPISSPSLPFQAPFHSPSPPPAARS